MNAECAAAYANAELAITRAAAAPHLEQAPTRRVALGDPQATALKLFQVLDAHGLLSSEGWLRGDVQLVSAGDHFDFGPFSDRHIAQREGLLVLGWLAAHPASQVTLLLGNHDLARVCELSTFDDITFNKASTRAAELYIRRSEITGNEWAEHEQDFAQDWPTLPGIEAAARDFSGYQSAQRALVRLLLTEGRFQLAHAAPHALVCHAGVTRSNLRRIGLSEDVMSEPSVVADALNHALSQAVSAWDGVSAFYIKTLHQPGSALTGGGRGILFHRPAHPAFFGETATGVYTRRYDPRDLPIGLTQVIGHIRDAKCRQLFGPWVSGAPADEGQLRCLLSDGSSVSYTQGVLETTSQQARLIFIDGGLNSTPSERYQLLDLASLTPMLPGRAALSS